MHAWEIVDVAGKRATVGSMQKRKCESTSSLPTATKTVRHRNKIISKSNTHYISTENLPTGNRRSS